MLKLQVTIEKLTYKIIFILGKSFCQNVYSNHEENTRIWKIVRFSRSGPSDKTAEGKDQFEKAH